MKKIRDYPKLNQLLTKFRHWPLHPQWLLFRQGERPFKEIGKQLHGRVLDIGCANQYMRTYITSPHQYIGLDYYQTATQWYATRPQVYGDAQQLPFQEASMDAVLLLDVLEHLPRPEDCVREVARVLKSQGQFILKVPFIYPIHDAPLDFHRWTLHGLRQLVEKHGFVIRQEKQLGKPLETGGVLFNIAIAKTVLNWIQQKNPAMLLGIIAPLVILSVNICCWILSLISPDDDMMPYSYRWTLEKM